MNLNSFASALTGHRTTLTQRGHDKNEAGFWNNLTREEQNQLLAQHKAEAEQKKAKIINRAKKLYCTALHSVDEINDRIKQQKELNEENDARFSEKYPMPEKLRVFSPKEKAERKRLHDEYQPKALNLVYDFSLNSSLISLVQDKQLEREIYTLLTEIGEDGPEKTLRNAEIFTNGTKEEKQAFVEGKVKAMLDLFDKFDGRMLSDRDIAKLITENYATFTLFPEADKLMKTLKGKYDITLSPELEKKLEENKSAIVGYGGYIRTLATISSDEYVMYDAKDIYDIDQAIKNTEGKRSFALLSDFEKEIYDGSKSHEIEELLLSDEPTEKLSNSTSDYRSSYEFLGFTARKESLLANFKKLFIPENATFTDLQGNTLNRDDAINKICYGEIIDVKDADGNFLRRYTEFSNLSYSITREKDYNILPEPMNVNVLKASIHGLISDVNKTTHWYMPSSIEYKEFRSALKELESGPLNDETFLQTKLEEVAKKADAYLSTKTGETVAITSNTEPRINAANKVSLTLHTTLARYKGAIVTDLAKADRNQKIDVTTSKESNKLEFLESDNAYEKEMENDKAFYDLDEGGAQMADFAEDEKDFADLLKSEVESEKSQDVKDDFIENNENEIKIDVENVKE